MDREGIAGIREEIWLECPPEVKQHMEQNGQVNAFPLDADIAAEQPNGKCVNALNHISMEYAKQECLEDIC